MIWRRFVTLGTSKLLKTVVNQCGKDYVSRMSVMELKKTVESLNAEERLFLAAYLKHLARVDDPSYQSDLTHLNAEIDAGKKFTLPQVVRMHEALKAEGLYA